MPSRLAAWQQDNLLEGSARRLVHIAVYQPLVYFMTKNILFWAHSG
jgi:hypothetical protein